MANPFGLPKVLLAEREACRRRQFRVGIYTALITASVFIIGMLMQGCRTQQLAPAGTATQNPVGRAKCPTPRQATNPLPTPMATVDDTNWISPQSTSLPENVTLPEPAPTLPSPTITPTPSSPVTPLHTASHRPARGIYAVKSGDTLSRIARAHGLTVKALKTANHLTSDRIFVGQKLKLSQDKPATRHTVQN